MITMAEDRVDYTREMDEVDDATVDAVMQGAYGRNTRLTRGLNDEGDVNTTSLDMGSAEYRRRVMSAHGLDIDEQQEAREADDDGAWRRLVVEADASDVDEHEVAYRDALDADQEAPEAALEGDEPYVEGDRRREQAELIARQTAIAVAVAEIDRQAAVGVGLDDNALAEQVKRNLMISGPDVEPEAVVDRAADAREAMVEVSDDTREERVARADAAEDRQDASEAAERALEQRRQREEAERRERELAEREAEERRLREQAGPER